MDLAGLPEELLRELSSANADVLERQILSVLRALDGGGDLDQILIGLYRKYHVIQKRRFLQNKLWRMVRKGRLNKPQWRTRAVPPQHGEALPPRQTAAISPVMLLAPGIATHA
ncbi:MAG: hypothetical protein WDM89_14825 [Rhizomicrobium sp.]